MNVRRYLALVRDFDPDDDYDSLAKCLVRSIDSLDYLERFLGEIIEENPNSPGLSKLKSDCCNLRDDLREVGIQAWQPPSKPRGK